MTLVDRIQILFQQISPLIKRNPFSPVYQKNLPDNHCLFSLAEELLTV